MVVSILKLFLWITPKPTRNFRKVFLIFCIGNFSEICWTRCKKNGRVCVAEAKPIASESSWRARASGHSSGRRSSPPQPLTPTTRRPPGRGRRTPPSGWRWARKPSPYSKSLPCSPLSSKKQLRSLPRSFGGKYKFPHLKLFFLMFSWVFF